MTIKKQYEDLYNFLKSNKNKKVSTIFDELKEMMSRQNAGGNTKTFVTDENGNVTHVFCYYHKKWESVDVAAYSAKKSQASGLNTMCKEGQSQWNRQQNEAKKAREDALMQVASGELEATELNDILQSIETNRKRIEPRSDEHGTDTL